MAALRRQVKSPGRAPSWVAAYSKRCRSCRRDWGNKGTSQRDVSIHDGMCVSKQMHAAEPRLTHPSVSGGVPLRCHGMGKPGQAEAFAILEGVMRVLFAVLVVAIAGLVGATVAAARHVRRSRLERRDRRSRRKPQTMLPDPEMDGRDKLPRRSSRSMVQTF